MLESLSQIWSKSQMQLIHLTSGVLDELYHQEFSVELKSNILPGK